MKRGLFLLMLGCVMWCIPVHAHDFTFKGSSGHTLAYTFLSDSSGVSVQTVDFAKLSGDLIIPDSVPYGGVKYAVKTIAFQGFYLCPNLESVVIPSTVTSIEQEAFLGCAFLESVVIPDGVVSIGKDAFQMCSYLKSVTIGSSVAYIGTTAFEYTKLEKTYFTGTVEQWCAIEFEDNPVTYSQNLYIADTLFTNLVLTDGVARIGKNAFRKCKSLKTVDFGSNKVSIGAMAFNECTGITSLYLGDSVYSIGKKAFFDCSNLQEVTFSGGVKIIDNSALRQCIHLKNIVFEGNEPPTFGTGVFMDIDTNASALVPCGTVPAYEALLPPTIQLVEDKIDFEVMSASSDMGLVNVVQQPTCENSEAVVQAVAFNGFRFTHWSDGDTAALRTITLTQDTVLIAYFGIDSTEGIDDVDVSGVSLWVQGRQIFFSGRERCLVEVYDCEGRRVYSDVRLEGRCIVPAAGVYIVRVDGRYLQRIVVL